MYSIDQPWSSISRFLYTFCLLVSYAIRATAIFLFFFKDFQHTDFWRACIIENVNPEEIDNYEIDKNIKFCWIVIYKLRD